MEFIGGKLPSVNTVTQAKIRVKQFSNVLIECPHDGIGSHA